jgi:L-iditol 2-dehydrogenase
MKACILKENNVLEYCEIDIPNISENEVLVKISTCGICSSDFNRVFNNGAYFYPIVLGHEFSGEIIECGENVDKTYLNKKVVVFPLLPCFDCEFCKQKMYAQCKNYSYFGSRQNGAYAEYIAVPVWNIKVIPNDMDTKVSTLAEPCAVAMHSISKILTNTNTNICISGTGAIGILIGLILKTLGKNVSFILRNERKLPFLKSLGFESFIDISSNKNFDVLFECVGSNQSLQNCIKYVRSRGQIILVGNPESNVQLDKKIYWKILRSEVTIEGVWNSSYKNNKKDDWDTAIEFLYKNSELVSKLITHEFDLSDSPHAFEKIKKGGELYIKGVFINEK